MKPFKIDKPFGPPKLRNQVQRIAEEISKRTPLKGFGIDISEQPDGLRISLATDNKEQPAEGSEVDEEGGGGGGTGSVDLYGSLNGVPAIFHLSQTADPDPIP